jgi:2',3'-cyclic-nucleotide 2'-phosphodiesterase
MRILAVGDVVGQPGRDAVAKLLPRLRDEYQLDLVVANGENAAGGRGLTPSTADELLRAGVDVVTSGNHIWHDKNIIPYLEQSTPVLRPLNFPPGAPGRGHLIYDLGAKGQVMVINLCGRVELLNIDCPFRTVDHLLEGLATRPTVIVVDMHAEATSEKAAMGWFLSERVSAVVGTHTHVPTADARILPGGAAFVSDLGMVGPRDSIIGVKMEPVIQHFLTGMPSRFEVAEGKVVFNAVLVVVNDRTGKAVSIERVDRVV